MKTRSAEMTEFVIQMAGVRIDVFALYEDTMHFCVDYLCQETADFALKMAQEDIDLEREMSTREDRLQGRRVQHHPDEYLETIALQRKIAQELLSRDVLLFHGSTIAVDGEAYLFTAKSGTGKSTHTRFWRELFGERAIMVNDDKPLLKLTEDGVLACGTPWDGKHHLSTNVCLPLKAICILERGEENEIHSISPPGGASDGVSADPPAEEYGKVHGDHRQADAAGILLPTQMQPDPRSCQSRLRGNAIIQQSPLGYELTRGRI